MAARGLLIPFVLAALFLILLPAAVQAIPAEPPTDPAPLDPARLGGGVDSLSGSYVVFDPSAGGDTGIIPGVPQTYCFRTHTYTDDYEYVYTLWLKFPADWVVTNIYPAGTPMCTGGGTWGTFEWGYHTPPYEVRIDHPRFQAYTDECVAYYCVDVIPGFSPPFGGVSWYYDGDGYNYAPHYPCSSDMYTPAGQYACDEWLYPRAYIPPCCAAPGVYLLPPAQAGEGCNGEPMDYPLTLFNATEGDGIFDLAYSLIDGSGTISGPAALDVPMGEAASFSVTLMPDLCAPPGSAVVGRVAASGNGYTDSATITETVAAGSSPDGGGSASAFVEKLVFCPACGAHGWLQGTVSDGDPQACAGGDVQSLSGSYIVFDPWVGGDVCSIPGAAATFCFRAESYTTDWEYVYDTWLRFPGDWTVTDAYLMGTPVCDSGASWGSFSWSFQTAPYEIDLHHSRYMQPVDHCVATYCIDTVAGSDDAPVSWYWAGDGYNAPPHHPCSTDAYTPAGQEPCDEWVNPPAVVPQCCAYLAPPCTAATVTVNPGNIHVPVDPASGAYGPLSLVPGEYSLEATAPGYSVQIAAVTISEGLATVQDFVLFEPIVDVEPRAISVSAPPNTPVTVSLTVLNLGQMALDWDLIEIPDLPWLWANPESGTLPELSSLEVEVTFGCTPDQDGQVLTGTLRLEHTDPCTVPIELPVQMACASPPQPDIDVQPPVLSATQAQDEVTVHQIDIHNNGTLDLDWTIVEHNPAAAGRHDPLLPLLDPLPAGPGLPGHRMAPGHAAQCEPADIPWAEVDPPGGTTPGGTAFPVAVSFDSTGLAAGAYTATLCVQSNDPDEPVVVVPLTMTVLALPTIAVSPSSLSAELCAGEGTTQYITVCNEGDLPLTWDVFEVWRWARPAGGTVELVPDAGPRAGSLAADVPRRPDDVSLVLDDGSIEATVGIGGFEFLWLNRFTPDPSDFRFELDQVQVFFSSAGLVGIGDDVVLVVYENMSGSADPAAGSTFLARFPVTVQALDTWNVYDLPEPVVLYGPGDVMIGVIAMEVQGGSYQPAAIDLTTGQQRSWFGWWDASPPPDPPLLPPPGWLPVDGYWPGNWMVRGYGQNICCDDIPWLMEDPAGGTLLGGECETVTVTYWSTGVWPGDYLGGLLFHSNDPGTSHLTVPVTLTVPAPAAIAGVTTTVTGLEVAFDAAVGGSAPLAYAWTFGDGGSGDVEDPAHTYAAGGCYTVTLDVANRCGQDAWTGAVCVCAPPANAGFSWSPLVPLVGQTVSFSATLPSGTPPFTYTWDWGDWTQGTGQYATHAYTLPGDYAVALAVDGVCGRAQAEHAITVERVYYYIYVPIVLRAGAP